MVYRSHYSLARSLAHLLRLPPGSRIANTPGRLLANVELGILEQRDEGGNNIIVDDCLDLVVVARRDVAHRPARLLADALLGARKQREEAREGLEIDYYLGLEVVAGDNVPHGPEGGGLNGGRGVEEELLYIYIYIYIMPSSKRFCLG